MKPVGFSFKPLAVTVSTAALVITAAVSPAATLTIDPDAGNFVTANGNVYITPFNGVLFACSTSLALGNVREIHVYGDMNVNAGDIVQATVGSTNEVRFIVSGNANIAPGGTTTGDMQRTGNLVSCLQLNAAVQ